MVLPGEEKECAGVLWGRKGHPNQMRCQGKLTENHSLKDQRGVLIGIPGRSYI